MTSRESLMCVRACVRARPRRLVRACAHPKRASNPACAALTGLAALPISAHDLRQYLCDGGPLEASGLGRRFGLLKSAAERVADADDGAFVVAYPSANLDEMLQVKEPRVLLAVLQAVNQVSRIAI